MHLNKVDKFFAILKEKYPDLLNIVVDWDSDTVTFVNIDMDDISSTFFSWPPVLPIYKTTTMFNSKNGKFYTKVFLS